MKILPLVSLGLLAALAAGAAPASAQTFSAVTYSPLAGATQLLSVSGSDGTASQTASLNPALSLDGLASYGGSLYTFDTTSSSLLQLNAQTGATVNSYSVSIPGGVAPGGLAISSTGLVYLANPLVSSSQSAPASALYVFGLTGGSALNVGTTGDLLSSLAFSSSDTLYGLGKGDGQLYTINTASAGGTLVGNLGTITVPDPFNPGGDTYPIDSGPVGALAFSGGTLYAAADDTLFTVSTATGAATAVDPTLYNTGFGGNYYSVSGLAPAAVPEASSAVPLGLGVLLLGVAVCRRKRVSA